MTKNHEIKKYLFFNGLPLKTYVALKLFSNFAVNQHFLLFPQCFLPIPKVISISKLHLLLSSANAFNFDQSKNLLFGKELKTNPTILVTQNLSSTSL